MPRPVRPGAPAPSPRAPETETRTAETPSVARETSAEPARAAATPAVPAAEVSGLVAAPADLAASPLGRRLGMFARDGDTLLRALSGVLGVDLPDIPELASLSLDDVEGGELTSSVTLVDRVTHKLPYEGRELALEIPANVHGLRANLQISLGKDADGDAALTGVSLRFERPQPSATIRRDTDPTTLPRITNPSALDPSDGGFFGRSLDALKDSLADIALRGFDVNADGSLQLHGLAEIADGLVTKDFHELAEGQLPVLNLKLRDLAAGRVIKGAAPSTTTDEPPGVQEAVSLGDVSAWLGSLSQLASRGDWELDLETTLGRFHSRGILNVEEAGEKLYGRASLRLSEVEGPDTSDVQLDALVRARGGTGRARVSLGGHEKIAPELGGVGASWDEHGLVLDGLDVDALLPVELSPWSGADAPRVGSAAFRERIAALLDDVAPVLPDQSVTYISDGHELLTERLRMIDAAGPGDALLLQTFILADDDTGSMVVDALIRAHERGADVRVLVDPVGSLDPKSDVTGPPPAVRRLADAGVDVLLFNDPATRVGNSLARLSEALRDHPALEGLLRDHAADAAASLAGSADVLGDLAALQKDPARLLAALPGLVELTQLAGDDGPLPADVRLAVLALSGSASGDALAERLVQQLGRDHRKQLILLGEGKAEVLTGGNNIEDTYQLEKDSPLYKRSRHGELHLWNDAHALVRGAAAAQQTARDFARTWAHQNEGAPLLPLPDPGDVDGGESSIRLVHHRPHATAPDGEGDNHFSNVLLATLEGLGAGDELTINNPYFLPLPELQDAMLAAAARGATLRVLTNGPHANNDAIPIAQHARRFVFPRLLAADGIEIYTTRADAAPVHKKTLVVRTAAGDSLYLVGSQNLDELSARVNREMFVLGGSALTDDARANDGTANAMLVEAERDLDERVAMRVVHGDLSREPVIDTAVTYLRSVLLPVL